MTLSPDGLNRSPMTLPNPQAPCSSGASRVGGPRGIVTHRVKAGRGLRRCYRALNSFSIEEHCDEQH